MCRFLTLREVAGNFELAGAAGSSRGPGRPRAVPAAGPRPPLESGGELEGTRIVRGAGILARYRLTCRPLCGALPQGRAEQEQVAVGVDVRELAHPIVRIVRGPA
jgi:hypothetical protein